MPLCLLGQHVCQDLGRIWPFHSGMLQTSKDSSQHWWNACTGKGFGYPVVNPICIHLSPTEFSRCTVPIIGLHGFLAFQMGCEKASLWICCNTVSPSHPLRGNGFITTGMCSGVTPSEKLEWTTNSQIKNSEKLCRQREATMLDHALENMWTFYSGWLALPQRTKVGPACACMHTQTQ